MTKQDTAKPPVRASSFSYDDNYFEFVISYSLSDFIQLMLINVSIKCIIIVQILKLNMTSPLVYNILFCILLVC